MYEIEYNFSVGQTVWIIHNGVVVECIVNRIVLEVDPDEIEDIIERKTYHLDPKDTDSTILLRYEDEIFETPYNALLYLGNSSLVFTPSNPTAISYDFAIDQDVWTYESTSTIHGNVIQITFDIRRNENGIIEENVLYHILPLAVEHDEIYSTLTRNSEETFETYDEVLYYISVEILELTPTPTITPTVTPTNTVTITPTVTSTVTPTVTPTSTVTPTMTVTPTNTATVTPTVTMTITPTQTITPTPSPILNGILDGAGNFIQDATYGIILEA